MQIPLWDSWLYGGEVFMSLFTAYRMVVLAGAYGSGKTVIGSFLCALLLQKKLVQRAISNIALNGAAPVTEYVPEGCVYESPYLLEDDGFTPRAFYGGDKFPTEDTAILMDEAALFMSRANEADDYVMALRKTNLFLIMASVWPVAHKLRALEVRRFTNWYIYGIPCWEYQWWLTNGKIKAETGHFYVWRPHRLFGVTPTNAFPTSDSGIADQLEYTFNMSRLTEYKGQRQAKKAVAKFDWAKGTASPVLEDLEENMNDITERAEIVAARIERLAENGRRRGR